MAKLIDLDAARTLVRERIRCNPTEDRSLTESLDYVLAETIVGQDDVPPFAKSLVDGFAVVAASMEGADGPCRLRIVEEIFAGQIPTRSIEHGQAAKIMTGAPVPQGADAVVMREETRPIDTAHVEIAGGVPRVGQHIMRQASAHEGGQPVVSRGQRLRPIEIGVLAEAGCSQVRVVRRASVATIQTGDELVEPGHSPGPGQIRNSNGPLLEALIRQANAQPVNLGIVPDTPADLRHAIQRGLQSDILLLSGGVSAGDKDFVPAALEQVGVKCVFHKVNLRPGKPIWFGTYDQHDPPKLVFGLPGNPISGLVGFLAFVAPALAAVAGHEVAWDQTEALTCVELAERFHLEGGRPAYWPGVRSDSGRVTPLSWLGSADPFSLVGADCLIFFAEGNRSYVTGEPVGVLPLI